MADRKIERKLTIEDRLMEKRLAEGKTKLEPKPLEPKPPSEPKALSEPKTKLEPKSPESRLPKKKPKRFSFWTIVVALIASYLFISVVYSSFKILELRKQESDIRADIAVQEQIAKDLKSEIEYLKTDAAVEKIAREELGLVRPDEILILPKKS